MSIPNSMDVFTLLTQAPSSGLYVAVSPTPITCSSQPCSPGLLTGSALAIFTSTGPNNISLSISGPCSTPSGGCCDGANDTFTVPLTGVSTALLNVISGLIMTGQQAWVTVASNNSDGTITIVDSDEYSAYTVNGQPILVPANGGGDVYSWLTASPENGVAINVGTNVACAISGNTAADTYNSSTLSWIANRSDGSVSMYNNGGNFVVATPAGPALSAQLLQQLQALPASATVTLMNYAGPLTNGTFNVNQALVNGTAVVPAPNNGGNTGGTGSTGSTGSSWWSRYWWVLLILGIVLLLIIIVLVAMTMRGRGGSEVGGVVGSSGGVMVTEPVAVTAAPVVNTTPVPSTAAVITAAPAINVPATVAAPNLVTVAAAARGPTNLSQSVGILLPPRH